MNVVFRFWINYALAFVCSSCFRSFHTYCIGNVVFYIGSVICLTAGFVYLLIQR